MTCHRLYTLPFYQQVKHIQIVDKKLHKKILLNRDKI